MSFPYVRCKCSKSADGLIVVKRLRTLVNSRSANARLDYRVCRQLNWIVCAAIGEALPFADLVISASPNPPPFFFRLACFSPDDIDEAFTDWRNISGLAVQIIACSGFCQM
ncbi:hypothetical protein CEXT_430261 [Caerostris extrusa]|uniref:Uncharacterized protein n=1 Tax=Caerostris extrusa TaxID=172846 RepID=A0AAV4Y0I2_CAEEX|nr:hypothetical protein CEXT_430261 [Caerostris extrusa]